MNRILIFILLMLCALFAAGQNNRIVSEGGGSNQDLEFDVETGILSITNGTGDTIPVMVGATAEENGASGLAPQPLAGQESLFLRGDGTYANPSTGGDNWGSQVVQKTARFSGDGTAGAPLELAQQSASSGQVLKWNGSSWAPAADTDTNTDAQTLSIASNSLSITGGNSVDLAPYLDNTDAQTLSLVTNTLSITGGNNVSLAAYLDNTDAQTLTFTESTRVLAISGGNSPDLSEGIQEEVNTLIVAGTGISKSYNDGGNTLTISSTVTDTDDQTLSLAGTLLSISEGNSVDIAGVDTDDQTLSFTSPSLSISGGNSVNLSELLDNQVIDVFQISSNTLQLSLEGDGEATKTVNLAPYLDNTDGQTLSYNAGTNEITISGGNTIDIGEVAENIYNASGTLNSDRELNTGGFRLEIKTSNSATTQKGLVIRSGYSEELANHFPLIIAAGSEETGADSIWFVSFDTNIGIGTNTNGMRYAQENTFTNPRHIVDKAYVDAQVSGIPSGDGIYGGDGYLVESTRASGGSSQHAIKFDSIGIFEIKDWNAGQALRVFQDIDSGAGKGFGRMLTLTDGQDSLDMSYTDGVVFDFSATKPIHFYTSEFQYFGNSFDMNLGATGTLTDNRATKQGLQYGADYSANYTSRSLVDKAYVDGKTGTNYLEVGASSTSTPAFSTTFSKFTHLTAGDDSGADWAWSTGTDLATYSGSTKVGFIYFSLSFRVSSTFNEITFVIRENGSETMAKAIVESLDAGVEHTASGVALVTFNNGDTFELGGYSQSGTPNVTVRHCNMTFFSFN